MCFPLRAVSSSAMHSLDPSSISQQLPEWLQCSSTFNLFEEKIKAG